MRRALFFLFLIFSVFTGRAQGDSSLTRDFERLSAKERARIAKKEQEESAQDPRYQAAMTVAEDLFRKQQYDDALVRYQEARNLRPLNVYPKVKIQDLQALIAKRDAEVVARTEVQAQPPAPIPVPADTASKATRLVPVEVVAVKEVPALPKPDTTKTVVRPKRSTVVAREQPRKVTTAAPVEPVKAAGPDGVEERMYMEGRAVVLERKVTNRGHIEVFRKVTHPWGQVNYFRDGIAISERVWKETGGAQ